MNRIRGVHTRWLNPFYKAVHQVSLRLEDVMAIVFWSDNYNRHGPLSDILGETPMTPTGRFSDELKNHTLSEKFPERVRSLLNLPRPLEIKGHLVREWWGAFRSCFPDFEVIELDAIVSRGTLLLPPEVIARHVHSVDEQRILRLDVISQLVDRS